MFHGCHSVRTGLQRGGRVRLRDGLGSLDVGGVNAYVSQGVLATDMDSINNQLTAYYVGEDMISIRTSSGGRIQRPRSLALLIVRR